MHDAFLSQVQERKPIYPGRLGVRRGRTLAGSILFAVPVLHGDSSYPRWMGLANPAVLVAVVAFAASASPWSRALIAPAAPNLAHLLFFLLIYRDVATRERA